MERGDDTIFAQLDQEYPPRTAQHTGRKALFVYFVHWSLHPHAHVYQPLDEGSYLLFS